MSSQNWTNTTKHEKKNNIHNGTVQCMPFKLLIPWSFLNCRPLCLYEIFLKNKTCNKHRADKTHTHNGTKCIMYYHLLTFDMTALTPYKYLQFQMLFFLLHQNNRNKQTNNSKNNNDIFFFTSLNSCIWVQSCDSYCYSMLSVFILFLIISFYSYFLYNMFSSEYAYAYACCVRVQSLKHIQ